MFARTVNDANASDAVLEARSWLKKVVHRAMSLVKEPYRRYLNELGQHHVDIRNIGSSAGKMPRKETDNFRLECEELFASHTAVDTVLGHMDTSNPGPEMTIVLWIPLNPVLSYPLIIGGGERGGGHQWSGRGENEMWSTHGLIEGEALAYLAPGPPSSSAMHGSAALPTDFYPNDINPLEYSQEDRDLIDFHPNRVDPALAQSRHRIILVSRVVT